MRLFLDEKQAQLQRQKMVRAADLPWTPLLPAIGKAKRSHVIGVVLANARTQTARSVRGDRLQYKTSLRQTTPGVMGPGVRQDDDGRYLRTIASTPSLRAQRSNPESFRRDGLDCFAALAIVDVR